MSVIVAPIGRGFQLDSLGGPEEAGGRFLSTMIAPRGSGLETNLIKAFARWLVKPFLDTRSELLRDTALQRNLAAFDIGHLMQSTYFSRERTIQLPVSKWFNGLLDRIQSAMDIVQSG